MTTRREFINANAGISGQLFAIEPTHESSLIVDRDFIARMDEAAAAAPDANHPASYSSAIQSKWGRRLDALQQRRDPDGIESNATSSAGVEWLDYLPCSISNGIATVYVFGAIYKSTWWRCCWQDLTATFKALQDRDDVTSVLLLVDSPGGIVDGLAAAYDALAALSIVKKTETQVVGWCASAAYHLACATHRITAERMDKAGSIGAKLTMYDYSAAYESAGIRTLAVDSSGPDGYKSLGVHGTKITAKQEAFLQEFIGKLFADFQSAVQVGRGFDDEQFAAIADGRFWLSADALELGLIDAIGSHDETVERLSSDDTTTTTIFASTGDTVTKKTEKTEDTPKVNAAATDAPKTEDTPKVDASATDAPKTDAAATDTPKAGAESNPAVDDSRAEFGKFQAAFGSSAGELFGKGLTFADAQTQFGKTQSAAIAKLTTENVELAGKVEAAKNAGGVDEPIETESADKGNGRTMADCFKMPGAAS